LLDADVKYFRDAGKCVDWLKRSGTQPRP